MAFGRLFKKNVKLHFYYRINTHFPKLGYNRPFVLFNFALTDRKLTFKISAYTVYSRFQRTKRQYTRTKLYM